MRDTSPDRLYGLLPGHIRAQDAEQQRPLQALLRLLTGELETVEADIDALYDNWFIETYEDWVIPYLGDLVGARPLRPFDGDGAALRAYVANTISYRQAKGTTAIIEQLGQDVSGWPCVAVEFYRRLVATQNVNHVRLGYPGTVSLADADRASLPGGPFEAANHHIDVRNIALGLGRYNISNVGLFVWRLQSYFLPFLYDAPAGYRGGVEPLASTLGSGFRFIDPVGRPTRLMNRPRTESSISEIGSEPTMPGPLRRRPLARDLDDLRATPDRPGRYFGGRTLFAVRLGGADLPLDKLHCCNLEDRPDGQGGITWGRPKNSGEVLFDPELGRLALHPNDQNKPVEVSYAYGAPSDIGGGPYDRRDSVAAWIDPFLDDSAGGTLWQIGVTRRTQELADEDNGGPVVATLAEAVAAWNTSGASRGIIAIMDSATYRDDPAQATPIIRIAAGARLAIVAADWPAERPPTGETRRTAGELAPQDRRPHIAVDLRVKGTGALGDPAGTLVLDGLLIGNRISVEAGDLGRLEIRHCTASAKADQLDRSLIVRTSVNVGNNRRLSIVVASSVIGRVDAASIAGQVAITDTIVGEDRDAEGDPASLPLLFQAPEADFVVQRSTIFGSINGRTLEADDSIFVGLLNIARRQTGCVRFCYVPERSRTPRRYRCTPDMQIAAAKEQAAAATGRPALPSQVNEQAIRERIRPIFTSTLFEHRAFGQLTRRCPAEIAAGAEGGLEMGAMNRLGNPARLANVADALEEYLPVGLTAGIIFVT